MCLQCLQSHHTSIKHLKIATNICQYLHLNSPKYIHHHWLLFDKRGFQEALLRFAFNHNILFISLMINHFSFSCYVCIFLHTVAVMMAVSIVMTTDYFLVTQLCHDSQRAVSRRGLLCSLSDQVSGGTGQPPPLWSPLQPSTTQHWRHWSSEPELTS